MKASNPFGDDEEDTLSDILIIVELITDGCVDATLNEIVVEITCSRRVSTVNVVIVETHTERMSKCLFRTLCVMKLYRSHSIHTQF